MNYWRLVLWSGEELKIKPRAVDAVKAKLSQGSGHIVSSSRTIAVKDVREFAETSEKFEEERPQLTGGVQEEIAQAFNEPIWTEDGVKSKAVKKSVTKKEYSSYYSKIPSYKLLKSHDNYMEIGFVMPVHLINPQTMTACTQQEADMVLTR